MKEEIRDNTCYAIIDIDNQVHVWSVKPMRGDCIRNFCENYGMGWKEARKKGFKCLKFKLTPITNLTN